MENDQMESDELKKIWKTEANVSEELFSFNEIKIRKTMKGNYRKGFYKLFVMEIVFAILSGYFILLFLAKFNLLDTILLSSIGMLSIATMLILVVVRQSILYRIYKLNSIELSYSKSIEKFTKHKIRFELLQAHSIWIGFLLIIAIMVLSVKIYGEYDVTQSLSFWGITLVMSSLFSFVYFNCIIKYYDKIIEQSISLLKEIEVS